MVSLLARGAGISRAAAVLLLSFGVAMPTAGGASAKTLNGEAGASAPAAPEVVDASASRTRFIIALERETSFQVSSLGHPNRVVVDLPNVAIGLPAPLDDAPVGLIKNFRGGLASPGRVKVVIDVTRPVIVEKAAIEPGEKGHSPRLVLEMVPVLTDKAGLPTPGTVEAFVNARLGSAGLGSVQPPVPHRAARRGDRSAGAFKPLIVLDPGHGGHDSGAARYGAVEKQVVLAFSLILRDRLLRSGRYKVMMTRNDDTFVPLDDRRDFAEKNRAALFMAIHADYAGSKASGATIYSLRDSVARDLQRSAVGEAKQNVLTEGEVQAIKGTQTADASIIRGFLADLAQREVEATSTRTSMFARSVIEYMGESTQMMSNPDRSAAFRVLKTATVPAVLLELAFVTNKRDAANLKSEEWRMKVADSIVEAVDNYFSNQAARLPL